MSLEHALIGEIGRLKGQLGTMVREVDQYRQSLENAQAGLATAEERLTNQRALISYLEMSLEEATDPVWKAGDRYKWSRLQHDRGTVIRIEDGTVHYRTDAGNELTASYANFERLAEKL